ncbi:MAG: hypothetical protein R3A80_09610 [Bdellovibrionota bacterium]
MTENVTESMSESTREVDRLKYRGNQIPLFIKFVWVAIVIYTVAYLSMYMWPDLKIWINK